MRRFPMILAAALLAAALLAGAAHHGVAQTSVIRVPGDQPTIQQALFQATTGTTILVARGVYKENLFWPKVDGIRLLAEAGPLATTIDGQGLARVVQFPTGLTAATRLEGFTLVNGDDPEGGGVRIYSSPTLIGNRIIFNRATGVGAARGGGVAVVSGSPRLERNLIYGNTAAALQAAGGGVFVGAGASAVLVGNEILGNDVQGSLVGDGGGVFVDAGGSASVIGNVVAGNRADSATAAAGAGIAVFGGPVDLLNNTVADNVFAGTGARAGGGVYFAASAATGSRLWNTILFKNGGGGGIQVVGGSPSLDHNDAWMNAGGDYVGIQAGPNDLALDPLFAGNQDYHLTAASKLIDAGASLAAVSSAGPDPDGDPRDIDGDEDGLAGNAARADIGADEFTRVRLARYGGGWGGTQFDLQTQGPAGRLYYLGVDIGHPGSAPLIQPFGQFSLSPWFALVAAGVTPGRNLIPIPATPGLAGLPGRFQALVVGTGPAGTVGAFTNTESFTILDPAKGVLERFVNTANRDSSGTTADWTQGSVPGLHATNGYGGSGADGVLDLKGALVLNSSTRTPGSDGIVDWNFQSIQIRALGSLVLRGPHPIRLRSRGNCVVEGLIDASGSPGLNAPAGIASQVGVIGGGAGGPGGGAGGPANWRPNSALGSLPMDIRGGAGYPPVSPPPLGQCGEFNRSSNRLITVIEANCGGGTGGNRGTVQSSIFRTGCSGNGGGHARAGQQTDFNCQNLQGFGKEHGIQWAFPTGIMGVQTPSAGSGGGGGGNAQFNPVVSNATQDVVGGSGGGGGGGLEIECAETIQLKSSGKILALGGNGGQGYTTVVGPSTSLSGGFGAGGAGGSIWLSGTSVTVDSGAVLNARGGQGNPNPPTPGRGGDGGDGYIIVRDRGGNPVVNGVATPALEAQRLFYDPPTNGKSYAYSLFYDAGTTPPNWAFDANDPQTGEVKPGGDLIFLTPPVSGQKVYIAFQGAPDLNGKPDPNGALWFPAGAGNFTPDIATIAARAGMRYIRFRVTFDLGKRMEGKPFQPVTIQQIRIRH